MAIRTQECSIGELHPTYVEYREGKTHWQLVHTSFPIDENLIATLEQIKDEVPGVAGIMRNQPGMPDNLIIVIKSFVELEDIKRITDTVLRKMAFRIDKSLNGINAVYHQQHTHHPVSLDASMAVSAASGVWHERDN